MSVNSPNDPEFNDAIPKPSTRRGFRFWEFLVILGVLGLLVAMLLPAVRSAGPAARRAQCTNNLKQIALALHNYEQEHHALPPAHTVDASGQPLHSWRTLILPYLELGSLYQTIDLSKPWSDPANAKARETFLSIYRCPEMTGTSNTTTYLAIVGPNACLLPSEPRHLRDISDAPEKTLMVIEAGDENAVPWMTPVDADEALVQRLRPDMKLHHRGGTNAAFVNGAVMFLKASVPATVRRALISISGNDEAATEW
jgi:type II secretory pathway pseudopilin PulG